MNISFDFRSPQLTLSDFNLDIDERYFTEGLQNVITHVLASTVPGDRIVFSAFFDNIQMPDDEKRILLIIEIRVNGDIMSKVIILT